MKYKDIGNWAIKKKKVDSKIDINTLLFDCFSGEKQEKLNHFAWLYDFMGRIRTLKKGDEIYRQIFNDYVTFGIWLRENDLVILNVKVKGEKVKERSSMFG